MSAAPEQASMDTPFTRRSRRTRAAIARQSLGEATFTSTRPARSNMHT
jgi:hypothetical protein